MQRDLFQIPAPSDTIASLHAAKGGLLEKFRISLRLDHILVLFLGLIFLYAFIYSMGVERGKKVAAQNIEMWQQKIKEALVTETLQKKTSLIDASKIPALPVAAKAQPAPVPQEAPRSALPVPAAVSSEINAPALIEAETGQNGTKPLTGRFTIQLVTLNSKEQAEERVEKLGKSGYHAFVIPSGKMMQVCINSFEKKSSADDFLKDLKQKGVAPADAYIRNIPR